MAVTGVPEPQADHAVIMIKFAREVMSVAQRVFGDLAPIIGSDTVDLAMRVGLHSGPTTAGVLRGQKSRFQLFGDTVNTASRMETTGVKGKIHLSEATAEELIKAGKGHWISPREELVQAKGKGTIQTYFVTYTSASSVGTRRSSSPRKGSRDTEEDRAIQNRLSARLAKHTSGMKEEV